MNTLKQNLEIARARAIIAQTYPSALFDGKSLAYVPIGEPTPFKFETKNALHDSTGKGHRHYKTDYQLLAEAYGVSVWSVKQAVKLRNVYPDNRLAIAYHNLQQAKMIILNDGFVVAPKNKGKLATPVYQRKNKTDYQLVAEKFKVTTEAVRTALKRRNQHPNNRLVKEFDRIQKARLESIKG